MAGFFGTIKDTLGRWSGKNLNKNFLAGKPTTTSGETRIYQFQLDEHGNMHPLPGVRQWEPRPDPRCTCNGIVYNADTGFEVKVHTAECAQTAAHRNTYAFPTRQLHISAPSQWGAFHNGEYSPSTTTLKYGFTIMDLTQQVAILQAAIDGFQIEMRPLVGGPNSPWYEMRGTGFDFSHNEYRIAGEGA